LACSCPRPQTTHIFSPGSAVPAGAAASGLEHRPKDFDTDTWFGLFFPKGTPEPTVRKLNAAIAVAIDTPSVQDQFKDIVANVAAPDRRSPEYLQKLVGERDRQDARGDPGAGIAKN
jgi:Tripartite tricarboxylate transporter family receptor